MRIRIWSEDDFALYLLPPDATGRCAYAFFDGGYQPGLPCSRDSLCDPIFVGADC